MTTTRLMQAALTISMAIGLAAEPLAAATSGLFTYTDNGSSITITDYPDTAIGPVVIPNTIAGKPVTRIDISAFSNCAGLTGVTIPSTVTSIGDSAFVGCSGLVQVTIPASVSEIGNAPFGDCAALTTISLHGANPGYSSRNGVLFNKIKTKLIQYPAGTAGSYAVPDSVTSIGDRAFYSCKNLTGVTLPVGVTSIGGDAFAYCYKLEGMEIPSGVISIGNYAFYYCTGLKSLSLPSSTLNIGTSAFGVCTSLPAISVDATNPNFSSKDGVLFDKHITTLIQCPSGVVGTYTIPSSVSVLADFAFGDCVALTGVSIPSSVTAIGGWAFYDCIRLGRVTIPRSVTSIGTDAFFRCYALDRALFRGDAPDMAEGVFDLAASGFTVYYMAGSSGFTSPTWHGYPARVAAPVILVQGPRGSSLSDGSVFKFGKVGVGVNSDIKTFKVKNTGTAKLKSLAITINGANSGNFKISPLGSTTLSPGASTTFTVRFKPGATGLRTAAIHIASNDGTHPSFDIHLTGTGVAVAADPVD